MVATTSETLKEIAELKNEIIKLTQSLRTIKGSQDDSPKESKLRESKISSASKGLKLTKKGFREDDILPQRDEDIEDSLAQDKSMENKWWS
jgi:replicative DNA helicase